MRQQFSRYNSRKARERRFGSSYHADAVHFDGGTYLTNNALIATDNAVMLLSGWIKFAGGLAHNAKLFVTDPETNANNKFIMNTSEEMRCSFATPDESSIIVFGSVGALNGSWHHTLMAIDVSQDEGLRNVHLYVDDVEVNNIVTDNGPGFTLAFNGLKHTIGTDLFGDDYVGDVADLWIGPGQFLDLSVEVNRRKFISAEGKPVDLGSDGSTPTGTAPAIFFSGNAASFGTNKGTGGVFTLTGSFTNASTSPSD